MSYCNAGHNPPLLIRKNGTVEQLEGGGMILGIFSGAEYTDHRVTLEEGDLLALFSDGVTEACQPDREDEFGEERLAELLAANMTLSSKEVIAKVMDALSRWSGGMSFADDVTVVIVRRSAGTQASAAQVSGGKSTADADLIFTF